MSTYSMPRKEFILQVICVLCGLIGVPGIMITHVTPQRSAAIFTPKSVITVLSLLSLLAFIWLVIQLIRYLKTPGQKVKFLAVALFSTLVGSEIFLILFVVFFQDQVILRNGVIFQPKSMSQETASTLVKDNVGALNFVAADQTRLQGWLVKNASRERSPLIIYFGGSSQEVSNMIPYFQKIDGWSAALINYRGYGRSEGTPSEDNLFQDSTLIYDSLSKRDDIDSKKIVTMGWSLGTGVSVYLSEQRPVSGTILVSPFDNWAHMFQSRDFPLIPLSFIKDKYFILNSISRAASIHTPLLCLVGEKDNIVLPSLSKDLARHWGGEETTVIYEDADHGLLFQENSSWQDISTFLESMK